MTKWLNTCLLVIGLILLALVVWECMKKEQPPHPHSKEGFVHVGSMDAASLDSSYNSNIAPEDAAPSPHFADVVGEGDQVQMVRSQEAENGAQKAIERLEQIHTRDLLPRSAAAATPYQVDIANTATWAYAVNTPRVNLGLDKLARQADPYRGDVPITYHPDVALIGKSHHGRDSLRLDGFFSSHFENLYNKYNNRAYKNLPYKVAAQETVMDY